MKSSNIVYEKIIINNRTIENEKDVSGRLFIGKNNQDNRSSYRITKGVTGPQFGINFAEDPLIYISETCTSDIKTNKDPDQDSLHINFESNGDVFEVE